MPLTPFHLGPGLFLGALTVRFFNFWAILLGSIVMDFEPAVSLLSGKCYQCPHHGLFHSILGAVLGSLILSLFLWKFKKNLNQISLKWIGVQQSFSFPVLFFSSLLSWIIHIFFDSLTHSDVFPLLPSRYNPILIGPEIYWPLNLILLIFGIFGLFLLIKRKKSLK